MGRHREAERRSDYRAGVLVSLVSGLGGKGKPASFWFPSLDGDHARMSDAAIVAKLQHLKTVFAKE
jgi:hypothetical protein